MRNNRESKKDHSKRIGNRKNRRRVSAGIFAALTGTVIMATAGLAQGMSVYAGQDGIQGQGTSGQVRSGGAIRYDNAVIDGDDLRKIDAYISEKKDAAAGALVRLGTKFRQQSGEYVYDRNPDAGQENIDFSGLSWAMLTQAARESQNVPEGLSVLNPERALHIEGVEERTDFYEAATEDNLSAGKAAWVDGRLLLGNGADNNRAYQQGVIDGGKGKIPENLRPIYGVQGSSVEIRHAHIGQPMESKGTSGCYYNYSETIEKAAYCDQILHYLDPVWSPNENEPGGGTWHGGFYTCSYHGGVFDSPGICGKKYTSTRTEWKYEIICGLEDMLYARLTIGASETEQEPDEAYAGNIGRTQVGVYLSATLEKGEGYDNLMWQEGDELVWTDDRGNVLGTGSGLMVFEPGIYRCSINVANSDIDYRTAEAVVTVSGLTMTGN